jgi:hypothetical protein
MQTHDTTKLGLIFAVPAFRMPAGMAPLAGVGGIGQRDGNAGTLRLIAEKRPQLRKGPIAVSRSLLWPCNPRPLTDPLEVFKDNRPLRAFGFGNEPLADTVVCVFLKPTLSPTQLTQASFGRLRSDLLECLATVRVPLTARFNMSTRKRLAVAVSRQIDDPKINTQNTFDIDRFGRFNFAPDKHIPATAHERQIGFTALTGRQLALSLATHKRDCLSAIESPDRDRGTFQVVGQDAVVVGHRTERLKRALHLSIQLIGIRNFSNTTYRKLRGQAERFTHRVVGQTVDRELAKRLTRPCHLADVVARGVGRFQRALERSGLFGSRLQFQLYRQSHIMMSIAQMSASVNGAQSGAAAVLSTVPPFLRSRKRGGFMEVF